MDKSSKTAVMMEQWRKGLISDGEITCHLAEVHQCEALAEIAKLYLDQENDVDEVLARAYGVSMANH